jgi:hypothetical protein
MLKSEIFFAGHNPGPLYQKVREGLSRVGKVGNRCLAHPKIVPWRPLWSNWNFQIVTSSPGYPRSNGQAERCVQTIKLLFKKAEESRTDPHIALLNYRAAPLSGSDKSPAELFLNRRLRTKLPLVVTQLIPTHAGAVREQLVD